MKGRAIPYSAEELAWIEERREWPRVMLRDTFAMLFDRQDVTVSLLNALCKRKGWLTDRTGRFEKGQEPHNKGKPCAEGQGGRHPNARRTQFRKGERRGVAVKLYKPIGTERRCKDGYLERKIHDGKPEYTRWRAVHLINWEAVNGPLPKGFCLKALDGDKANTDPANWKPIPRSMLPALAGGNRYAKRLPYDAAAPELRPALLAMAEIEHHARKLKRGRVPAESGADEASACEPATHPGMNSNSGQAA